MFRYDENDYFDENSNHQNLKDVKKEVKDEKNHPPLERPLSSENMNEKRLYSITLDSSSSLGTYSSQGKGIITKIDKDRFDLKAVLYPINASFISINQPYYIHAIATKSPGTFGSVNLSCSGYAKVTKLFSTYLPATNIKVHLDKPLTSHCNNYNFSLNPFTLFGMSPGQVTNTGKLMFLGKEIDEQTASELAECDKIELKPAR